MPIPVLICDDSNMARKQLERALPKDWDISLSFADGGVSALAGIKAGKADVLFLDLTMPGMDGYEVLQAIRDQDLPTVVIVVSGDIQPEARERVLKLGALEFLKKPLGEGDITAILEKYGLHHTQTAETRQIEAKVDICDGIREVANVAMGQAADLLAQLLGAFVVMPIPSVDMMEPATLKMTMDRLESNQDMAGVCQGFTGSGIAGEALLIFTEARFQDIADLLHYEGAVDDAQQVELLTDIANIIISASLKGIADQLDITLSQGHPMALGHHVKVGDLLRRNAQRWTTTLAIEMTCSIEGRHISCDLLLLFTKDSIEPLTSRVSYLIE